jgi:GTP cyclohydrolase I
MGTFDDTKIEQGVRLILEGIGEDPERGGLKETPARVARMYREIAGGVGEDPTGIVTVVEGADFDEMIMVRDIPLYSICEHHLIPFSGQAHVAYVPNKAGQITGLSKIARVVDVLAKKPQVQERLTTEIADTIERARRVDQAAVGDQQLHGAPLALRAVTPRGSERLGNGPAALMRYCLRWCS